VVFRGGRRAPPAGAPVPARAGSGSTTPRGTPIYAHHAASRSVSSLLTPSTPRGAAFSLGPDTGDADEGADSDDDGGGTPLRSEFHFYARGGGPVSLPPRSASALSMLERDAAPSPPPRASVDGGAGAGAGDGEDEIAHAPRWPIRPNAAWPADVSCVVVVLRSEGERRRAVKAGTFRADDDWVEITVPDVLPALRELRAAPFKFRK
jgi:hypothetical protein